LKDVKTSKGYTLSNAIQTGVKTAHLGVGITAGDEESWEAFKEIMYPVIKGWHGFDPEVDSHKVNQSSIVLCCLHSKHALFATAALFQLPLISHFFALSHVVFIRSPTLTQASWCSAKRLARSSTSTL
jgi:hypothetical protein